MQSGSHDETQTTHGMAPCWSSAREAQRSGRIRMTLEHLMRSLGLALLLLAALVPARALATPYFPNLKGDVSRELKLGPKIDKHSVLLILVDTIRPDHMSAYGYPKPTSPFMEQMAKEGVLFANHFSNSSWTKPSVASLFTGLYPRRHTVLPITAKMPSNIKTLAQVLRDAGYKTGAVLGNNFGGRRYGLDRGFDRFADPSSHFGGKPPSAAQLLALAKKWIEEDMNEPFFYTLFLFDPHDPYTPPPTYHKTFCPECTRPEIVSPLREYNGHGPNARQISDMKGLYDGEIRYMDDQLKLFYDELKGLGLEQRLSTIVVGDHGEAFGEHKVFEHAFHTWDEVIRTPLIVHSPRLKNRGSLYNGLTSHVDVLPTILKLTDVKPPSGLQGTSLVQVEGEAVPPPTRMVVTEVHMYGIHRVTMRDYEHKLVYHAPLDESEFFNYYSDLRVYPSVSVGAEKKELYNVQKDPFERQDIYPTSRAKALSLERMLERYLTTGGLDEDLPAQQPSEEVMRDLKSLGYIQ